MKAPFLPKDEPGKRKWLTNFAAKLPTYAPTVGVTAGEVAQAAADSVFFGYVCDAHEQHTKTTRDWTAYKHAAAQGDALGNIPVRPRPPAAGQRPAEHFWPQLHARRPHQETSRLHRGHRAGFRHHRRGADH